MEKPVPVQPLSLKIGSGERLEGTPGKAFSSIGGTRSIDKINALRPFLRVKKNIHTTGAIYRCQ
jgi:hypothetical protein